MPIVFVTGRYQLGNNPGIFQDATYVGHEIRLPFVKTWLDPNATQIGLQFYTHDIETWGSWSGHRVAINGTEIGRLKDPADTQGSLEMFSIVVSRTSLEAILNGDDNFILSIELDRQPAHPGLADDFVLTRIESDGSFAAMLGWK